MKRNYLMCLILIFPFLLNVGFFNTSTYNNYTIRRIKENSITENLSQLLSDKNPFVQIATAKVLIKKFINYEEALDVLEKLKESSNPEVQFEVAKAYLDLGIMGEGMIILDRLSELNPEDYPYLLLKVAKLLLDYKEEDKAVSILSSLYDLDNWEIVDEANYIYNRYISLKRVRELISEAEDETLTEEERKKAIWELISRQKYNNSEIKEVYLALNKLAKDKKMLIRFDLANALLFNPLYYDWAVDVLVKLTKDKTPRVWFTAIKALRNWGNSYLNNSPEIVKNFLGMDNDNLDGNLMNRIGARDKVLDTISYLLNTKIGEAQYVLLDALGYWGVNSPEVEDRLDYIANNDFFSQNLRNYAQKLLDGLINIDQIIESNLKKIREYFKYWLPALNVDSLSQIASLWILYGFEDARIILGKIAAQRDIDIDLREKAIASLSYRDDGLAISGLLTLLDPKQPQIYEVSLNAILKPWWINKSFVREKLFSILRTEKDLNIVLSICQAYIKWGRDYNSSIIQNILLKIANDKEADSKFRTYAIELLGELS